jgi:hypothetical protein
MAKRVRGSSRPGKRRPIDRRSASAGSRSSTSPTPSTPSTPAVPAAPERRSVAPRPSGLTEAEVARAAEIEAALLADERAAEATRRRSQQRISTVRENAGARSLKPEQEYAYVARDVRDIVRIATLLLVVLFSLWIAIDVVRVVKIV